MRESLAALSIPCVLALTLASARRSRADDLPPPPPQAVSDAEHVTEEAGIRRFALIVVGLPGDEEHASLFMRTVDDWSDSLKTVAGVPEDRLCVAGRSQDGDFTGATGERAQEQIQRLSEQIQTEDALWVFFLGHGSYDGQHTWFHLAGPDLHEGDWADLFARINCREQVFWLTQSASGGFVRALSRPDRIVIAATAATGETNETRFPHEFSDVLQSDPVSMDADSDGRLSVLEMFRATDAGVASYFEENELAATEHAQLEDNGDGEGSEADGLIEPGAEQTDPNAPQIDGALAAKTFVTTITATPAATESAGDEE